MVKYNEKRGSCEAQAGYSRGQRRPFTVWESDRITVKLTEGRDHDWLPGRTGAAAFTYGANETISAAALEVTPRSGFGGGEKVAG